MTRIYADILIEFLCGLYGKASLQKNLRKP